jgi:predicted nucleotide-binding protein
MPSCLLTDKQKELLRSIVPGLKDGTVDTHWIIAYGDDSIMAIFGLDDDGSLWRTYWENVKYSDFDKFVKCGFFSVDYMGQYGPESFILDDALIIASVESNFGETNVVVPKHSQPSLAHDKKKVFVVHGRNLMARDQLFAFLRAIGLKPIEWSEAVSSTGKGSPYLGEVLDAAFSMAQAVVVLMTPEDEARLMKAYQSPDDEPHETEFTPQARPNVIFEAGMAMGRSPERTILVELGKLRPFSDIGGRHVIRLNNTSAKRKELAQRLKTAGCNVDLTDMNWDEVGDFTANLATNPNVQLEKTKELIEVLKRILHDEEEWECGQVSVTRIKDNIY